MLLLLTKCIAAAPRSLWDAVKEPHSFLRRFPPRTRPSGGVLDEWQAAAGSWVSVTQLVQSFPEICPAVVGYHARGGEFIH